MSKFTAAFTHTGILTNAKFISSLYRLGQLCCFLWSIPYILILPTNAFLTIQQVSCLFTQLIPGLPFTVSLARVTCSYLPRWDLSSHYGPKSHQTYPLHCLMEHWSNNYTRMPVGVPYVYLARFLDNHNFVGHTGVFVPSFAQLVGTHGNHGI